MATEYYVRLADDLDKSVEAAETITFAFRGHEYEIDLSNEHIADLAEKLAPYIQAARRTDVVQPPQALGRNDMGARRYKAAMRAWGEANGFPPVEPGGYHPRDLARAFAEHVRQQAESNGHG